jgi:DNA-binding GntR family transcriptional regulator
MQLTAPLMRQSLHDELVTRLRQAIVDGTLEAGAKVPERALCEQLGVSRTPLREALKVLANEGLISLEPNRGARVSSVTMEELEATFPVIAVLEGLAGKLACAQASDADIARIVALHDEMFRCYEANDKGAYFRANRDIHNALFEAAGNPVLSQQYATLSSRVERARLLANVSTERWAEAVGEHRTIVDAIARRDGALLCKLLESHLNNKLAALKRGMKSGV